MYNRIVKTSLFLLISIIVTTPIAAQESPLVFGDYSQGSDEDDASTEDDGGAPNQGMVPLDGGLSLLFAAGAAYGVSRLKRRGG